MIALLFGQLGFEDHPALLDGWHTQRSNSFAIRLVADIYNLKMLTDYEDWRGVWGESFTALFNDEHVSHLFLTCFTFCFQHVPHFALFPNADMRRQRQRGEEDAESRGGGGRSETRGAADSKRGPNTQEGWE